jgi:hypothetical protein
LCFLLGVTLPVVVLCSMGRRETTIASAPISAARCRASRMSCP